MTDYVATVPMQSWAAWLREGGLAPPDGSPSAWDGETESHWWIAQAQIPLDLHAGDRLYLVAFGRLRGYAPVAYVEDVCRLNYQRACIVRRGGAVAVTLAGIRGAPATVRGFQGLRRRWWDRAAEQPYPHWQTENVPP